MAVTAPHDEVHTSNLSWDEIKVCLILKIALLRSSYLIKQVDFLFEHFTLVSTACQLGVVTTSATDDSQITRTMDQLQRWYHLAPPLPPSLIKVRLNIFCMVFQ